MDFHRGHDMSPPPPDVNQGPWIFGVDWTTRCIAIGVVLVRLYSRKVNKGTAGFDDLAIAIAMCLCITESIGDSVKIHHGFGRHIRYLSEHEIMVNLKWLLIQQLENFISLFFIRTSICLFTLRFLPKTQKWPQRVTYFAIALNFAATLVNCVVFSVRCRPIERIWDRDVAGVCISEHSVKVGFIVASVLGVLVDFMVVLVPLFVIKNLQASRRTKIALGVVMGLSVLTACCSIAKVVAVRDIRDPTWDAIAVQVLSFFEENFAIIFASLPALRQLYLSKRKRILKPRDAPAAGGIKMTDYLTASHSAKSSTHSVLVPASPLQECHGLRANELEQV